MPASASQPHQRPAGRPEHRGGLGATRRRAALVQPVRQSLEHHPPIARAQRVDQVDRENRQRLPQHPRRTGG